MNTKATKLEDKFTIAVALPHKCLSPNARAHWHLKSVEAKKLRNAVANTIRYRHPRFTGVGWANAKITYSFFFENNRNRDDDNYRAMMKSARDAYGPEKITRTGRVVAGAGVVLDDSGISDASEVQMSIDKSNPRVEITIEKVGE